MTRVANGIVQTYTGALVSVLEPDPQTLHLLDVAVGLSRAVRFRGQTRVPYVVLEHCVRGSFLVEEAWGRDMARAFLMHDCAEAYLGDLASPIKYLPGMEMFHDLERRLERAAAQRWDLVYPWPEEVRVADYAMLQAEAQGLMRWDTDEALQHWGPVVESRPGKGTPNPGAYEHFSRLLQVRECASWDDPKPFLRRAAELGLT